jgi:uncharacterized protein YigE (DUF2233 family)
MIAMTTGLLTVVFAAASVAAPAAPAAATASVAWTEMAPGAAQATLTAADGTKIRLYRFAFPAFEAKVFVGAGKPPRPETAAALRRRLGATAAVNGGFFDEHRAPLGLRIASGETRVKLRPRVDWGVLVLDGASARIIHSRDWHGEAVSGAIQVGPRLVVDGKPLQLKPALARRTAVALPKDGRALTLAIVDDPIDANELATLLADAGFDTALMLDGGPSTQLALDLGDTRADIPGGYAVPDLLVITKPKKP